MLSSVNNPDTIPENDLFDALQLFVTVPVVPFHRLEKGVGISGCAVRSLR